MSNYFDELCNINSNYNNQLFFRINYGSDGIYKYINISKYQFINFKRNIKNIIHTLNAL